MYTRLVQPRGLSLYRICTRLACTIFLVGNYGPRKNGPSADAADEQIQAPGQGVRRAILEAVRITPKIDCVRL